MIPQTKTITKSRKPWERWEEPGFQSYHTIRFRCPVCSSRIPGEARDREVRPTQGGSVTDLRLSLKRRSGRCIRQRLYDGPEDVAHLEEGVQEGKNAMCEQNLSIRKELESPRDRRKGTVARMKTSLVGFGGRKRRWGKESVNLKTGKWGIWRLRTRERKDRRKANRASSPSDAFSRCLLWASQREKRETGRGKRKLKK